MPTKTLSLFDDTFEEPPKEKKPTLLQYLKATKDIAYPFDKSILLVWFPGKFDNYTLETEVFRCQITPTNPMYKLLDKLGYKVFKDTDTALLLRVVSEKPRIQLAESNLYGKYTDIGNIGVKFSPTEGAN